MTAPVVKPRATFAPDLCVVVRGELPDALFWCGPTLGWCPYRSAAWTFGNDHFAHAEVARRDLADARVVAFDDVLAIEERDDATPRAPRPRRAA